MFQEFLSGEGFHSHLQVEDIRGKLHKDWYLPLRV